MNFRELEKMLKADGWRLARSEGSHHHYRHPAKSGLLTIPRHPGDIDPWLLKSILKRAQIKEGGPT
jgi:predicted RNA binding protein YcfA (HicA-like mRNA interferase family)